MGFNIWLRRPTGRSLKGQRIHRIVPTVRGKNITMVLAISKNGPILHKFKIGAFNGDDYQEFIHELSSRLPNQKHYLIQDNAPIHRSSFTPNASHIITNLPPYSPCLNPIESVFSKLKRHVRSQLSIMDLTIMNDEGRLHLLKGIVDNAFSGQDYNDLSSYYHHIKKFTFEIALKKDVFGD